MTCRIDRDSVLRVVPTTLLCLLSIFDTIVNIHCFSVSFSYICGIKRGECIEPISISLYPVFFFVCLCLRVNTKPFIWSKLHNFGDTNGMRGDLNHLNEAFPYQALEAQSSIIGIGATPEGATSTIETLFYHCLFNGHYKSQI